MRPNLKQVSCASIPPAALAVLADLRREPGIRVYRVDDRVWIRWPAGDERVTSRLLPVPKVRLYAHCEGFWFQPDHALPELHLPRELETEGTVLGQAILPARMDVIPPTRRLPRPARLRLVRDPGFRPTSALRCPIGALAEWAEKVPVTRLRKLLGATDGASAMVLGRRLPGLPDAERFWGNEVLSPLGFRADPKLPERAMRRAIGVGEGELLILSNNGYEAIPKSVFRPLARAGIRLALGASDE